MQQQLRPFEMPEKPVTKSVSFVRAFDQSGNVRNDEGVEVTKIDHTQVRFQRREWIISNLRSRRRNSGNESWPAGIREPDEANIGEQLQLHLQFDFFAGTSLLMVTRRTIRRRRKVSVPKSAAPTARRAPARAVQVEIE